VIACDPALTARLLRYANSPLIGAQRPITSIAQAVLLLGWRSVSIIARGFSVVRRQTLHRCPRFHFDNFWAWAIATATSIRTIARNESCDFRDTAFVAGLLTEIGRLVLATGVPDQYESVLASVDGLADPAAERRAFGTDYIEIGAEVLARWQLPSTIVDAVRFQAAPDQAPDAATRNLANSIRQSQAIANALCSSTPPSAATAGLDETTVARLHWESRELAGILDIPLGDLPNPEALETDARDLQEDLSVRIQAENLTLQQLAGSDPLTGVANRRQGRSPGLPAPFLASAIGRPRLQKLPPEGRNRQPTGPSQKVARVSGKMWPYFPEPT
jgi:HD-like signal output (HDOD) protein